MALTGVNARRSGDWLSPAMAVLIRDGVAGLTMRNVAAEAGVSATALYRHFEDKEALLRALIQAAYAEFRRALVIESTTGDPAVLLGIAFDRFIRFGLTHPNHYRLLFVEPHGLGIDRYPHDFVNGRSPTFRQLRDLVAAAMETKVLAGHPKKDAPDVALTIYAHLHGLVMLYLGGRFPDQADFERFAASSMERLLAGLRP